MTPIDYLAAAGASLRANILRSILTTLGVVIGVAAVVALLSVGASAKAEIDKLIGGLGSNLIVAMPGASNVGGARMGIGSASSLTRGDAEALAREVASARVVAPVVQGGARLVAGGQNWSSRLFGVTETYLVARDLEVAHGAGISAADERGGRKVAVLGHGVAEELFGALDPIGADMRIDRVPFEVIGVLEEQGSAGMGQSQDDVVLVPLSTAVKRVLDRSNQPADRVDLIFIKALSAEAVDATERAAEQLLRDRHRIAPGEDADFFLQNLTQILAAGLQAADSFGLLLAAIGAISLLVGGIGIMNIMLVSVTERTREIGLRLAVGARRQEIEGQFLIEAVALCLLGGLLGAALGVSVSALVADLFNWPFVLDPMAVIIAFVASASVGLFFGFYPARKASRLDPIEALRHE